MILCLDCGNSRLKWGVWHAEAWLAQGACGHAELSGLADLAQRFPTISRVLLANVAGPLVESGLRQVLSALPPLEVIRPCAQAAGVSNGYLDPSRLGVDRWCALIGARHLQSGNLLVVMAGTATTIDTLDARGNFLGGLILPGQQLMLGALARDTAALPFACGRHEVFPRQTDDAIVSGAIEAQVGAIERAWQRLPAGEQHCLLSGGGAEILRRHLVIPVREVENLPLVGLKELAQISAH